MASFIQTLGAGLTAAGGGDLDSYMKPHKVSPIVQVRPLYGTYIQ